MKETSENLDSRAFSHSDGASKLSVSSEEMHAFFKSEKSPSSSSHEPKSLDMGSLQDLYGTGAYESTNQLSDKHFDLGAAVGGIVEAGRKGLEELGKGWDDLGKAVNKPNLAASEKHVAAIARDTSDDEAPFNPDLDFSTAKLTSMPEFEKCLAAHPNDFEIRPNVPVRKHDCDPGFELHPAKRVESHDDTVINSMPGAKEYIKTEYR
jgi:hypothetical protein